jgi:hypothetical protein
MCNQPINDQNRDRSHSQQPSHLIEVDYQTEERKEKQEGAEFSQHRSLVSSADRYRGYIPQERESSCCIGQSALFRAGAAIGLGLPSHDNRGLSRAALLTALLKMADRGIKDLKRILSPMGGVRFLGSIRHSFTS